VRNYAKFEDTTSTDVTTSPNVPAMLVLFVLQNQKVNPLTPELNPSAQGCLPGFLTGNFTF
jgi:hypothetical protein